MTMSITLKYAVDDARNAIPEKDARKTILVGKVTSEGLRSVGL